MQTFSDEIVARYGDVVYRFCRSLTFTKDDADDLFQDTFVKAMGHGAKMRGENPQGFLFSCAVYLWKSRKRKYARRNRIAPSAPLDEGVAAPSGFDVGENFAAQEELRTVRALVSALPEKFKMPIILMYTAELGVSEIAAALKIPEGTVKSRLYKARKLLQEGLVEHGYGN